MGLFDDKPEVWKVWIVCEGENTMRISCNNELSKKGKKVFYFPWRTSSNSALASLTDEGSILVVHVESDGLEEVTVSRFTAILVKGSMFKWDLDKIMEAVRMATHCDEIEVDME